jgi:NTE family protein
MKALILGGGSLKGAWQVGVIQAILETGFKPDMIYGISAGALNASFLVNETHQYTSKNQAIPWLDVNKQLMRFWLENINKPEDIGIPKSKISLGIETLWSRFDGLIDTTPLHEKIKKFVIPENLKASPIKLKIGAVDINSGLMHYINQNDDDYLDYLRASSSLPIIMPGIPIGGNHKKVFLDGGLREVVPLKQAILDGASEVFAVATHPANPELKPINHRSLFSLIERIKDISVNQFEANDLDWAQRYEEKLLNIGDFSIKKKPNISIFRPKKSIKIEITNFTKEDVKRVIAEGYEMAYAQIKAVS